MAIKPMDFDLHDHAGARWLAAFTAPFVATIVAAFVMLVYPYITG